MIIDFLNHIRGSKAVQFTDLKKSLGKYNDAIKIGGDLYFVAGGDANSGSGSGGRYNDSDITAKKYFAIDIDIRAFLAKGEFDISDKFLDEQIEIIKGILDNDKLFSQYSYIVHSGNGIHIYYCGTEKYFNSKVYNIGVMYIYETLLKPLLDPYPIDTTTRNISQLFRLPGSINTKRKTRYGLEEMECKIIYDNHNNESELFNNIEKYSEIRTEYKQQVDYSTKNFGDSRVYETISDINVGDLFCHHTGSERAPDGKNFINKSYKKGYNGLFYMHDLNLIFYTGTNLIKSNMQVYNPFTYVKYEILNNGNNKDVYNWFKERYPNVKDADRLDKKDFIIQKKIEAMPKQNNTKLYENQFYVYPGQYMADEFGGFISGDLVTVASRSNSGKTSMVLNVLKANKDKGHKTAIINMEFDLDQTFKFNFLRREGYQDNQLKKAGTDDLPLSKQQEEGLKKYIEERRKETLIIDMPQNTTLQDVVDKITELGLQGYSMIAVDSISSIMGCEENAGQISAYKTFRTLCTQTGIVVIGIHHFNKGGKEISGSQKIEDLSNVLLSIYAKKDSSDRSYREIVLWKDKAHSEAKSVAVYQEGYGYVEVPKHDRGPEELLNRDKK